MNERRTYAMTVTIDNATHADAETVREELAGAIEDARDSAIWVDPVDVSWSDPEPVDAHFGDLTAKERLIADSALFTLYRAGLSAAGDEHARRLYAALATYLIARRP